MRGGEAQKERVREITAQRSTAIIKCQKVFNGYSVRTTLCGARLKLTLNPHPL